MSHPPDYPGRRRVQRSVAAAAGGAYQGAFEAVGAVLIGCGAGYWVDRRWGTTPYGVIVGLAVGFAAMVLRLLRLNGELHLGADGGDAMSIGLAPGAPPGESGDPAGFGEVPGLSDALREDSDDVWNETWKDAGDVAGKQHRAGSVESKDDERKS